MRDRVFLATKGGHVRTDGGGWATDSSAAHLHAAVDDSLQRLGVDQLSLWQHHRPDAEVPYDEVIGDAQGDPDSGKVAHLGLSNADPDQIRAAHAVLGDALVSVQNQFSPKFRSSKPEIEVCDELGLAFLPWSPLGGLSDAKELADEAPGLRRDRAGPGRQRPAGRTRVGARPVAGRHPDPGSQATVLDHRLRCRVRDRADGRGARPASTRADADAAARSLTRVVDTVMDRSLVLGYTTIGLAVRRALPGWPADPPAGALEGRHVLVTGASSGLGIATVEGVADLGATVHMLVRDEVKGRRVADEIRATRPGVELRLWRCDVGDLDDVRRFAARLRGRGRRPPRRRAQRRPDAADPHRVAAGLRAQHGRAPRSDRS